MANIAYGPRSLIIDTLINDSRSVRFMGQMGRDTKLVRSKGMRFYLAEKIGDRWYPLLSGVPEKTIINYIEGTGQSFFPIIEE